MLELPLRSRNADRPRLSEAIGRELVERLFANQSLTLGGAIGVLLQGALCYTNEDTRWLVAWALLSFAIMLVCLVQEHAFRRRRNPLAPTTNWERWYVAFACFNAFVFGIGGAAAVSGISDGLIRLVLYGGWNAYIMGGAQRNAYSPLAARCYIGCATVPIVAVILWNHAGSYLIYLIVVLMFTGTALSVADQLYAQTVNFLRVDEERVALVHAEARSNRELASANERLGAANEQLAALARIDGLTGIANRRAFDERLGKIMAASRRDRFPVSLLMIDIDWFKKYNDRYGHQAGDECLRRVAQVLADCMRRPADLIARYGGEEFVALLPNTDEAGVAAVGELMRRAVEELGIQSEASHAGVVTLSIGAATAPFETSWPGERLIRTADSALYAAKQSGRNRVGGIRQHLPAS